MHRRRHVRSHDRPASTMIRHAAAIGIRAARTHTLGAAATAAGTTLGLQGSPYRRSPPRRPTKGALLSQALEATKSDGPVLMEAARRRSMRHARPRGIRSARGSWSRLSEMERARFALRWRPWQHRAPTEFRIPCPGCGASTTSDGLVAGHPTGAGKELRISRIGRWRSSLAVAPSIGTSRSRPPHDFSA
jgi:hypothetical protein